MYDIRIFGGQLPLVSLGLADIFREPLPSLIFWQLDVVEDLVQFLLGSVQDRFVVHHLAVIELFHHFELHSLMAVLSSERLELGGILGLSC